MGNITQKELRGLTLTIIRDALQACVRRSVLCRNCPLKIIGPDTKAWFACSVDHPACTKKVSQHTDEDIKSWGDVIISTYIDPLYADLLKVKELTDEQTDDSKC